MDPELRTIYHQGTDGGSWVDATCRVMSVGSPSRVVRGRRVSGPNGPTMTKTCQRLGKTCTGRQRSIAAVSAAPGHRTMPNIVRSGLKHDARRAEMFIDRLGAGGLAVASPRGRLTVKGSGGVRTPGPPASAGRGPAGSHLPRSAVTAHFRVVRGMHAAVVVTAIVLAATTAARALTPPLRRGYPREGADLALDTAASVIRLAGCLLGRGRR